MSRRFYRATGPVKKTRVNHEIRLRPIKVIDQDNKMLGEMPTDQAKRLAQEAGLDLVEINPDVRPPLCKITDYGKYKYEQSKNRPGPKQKSQELKEVRLGRSMKIDEHDVGIRVAQARKFLMEGHKVQLVAQFRGREMAYRGIGIERLKKIVEELGDISKVETPLRSAGRRMNMILSPDKQRIEAIKRREEALRANAAAEQSESEDESSETADVAAVEAAEGEVTVDIADVENSTNDSAGKKRPKDRDEPTTDDPEDTLERMMSEMNTL